MLLPNKKARPMTKASIIEKTMMHPFFLYFPIEDSPSLLLYFPYSIKHIHPL